MAALLCESVCESVAALPCSVSCYQPFLMHSTSSSAIVHNHSHSQCVLSTLSHGVDHGLVRQTPCPGSLPSPRPRHHETLCKEPRMSGTRNVFFTCAWCRRPCPRLRALVRPSPGLGTTRRCRRGGWGGGGGGGGGVAMQMPRGSAGGGGGGHHFFESCQDCVCRVCVCVVCVCRVCVCRECECVCVSCVCVRVCECVCVSCVSCVCVCSCVSCVCVCRECVCVSCVSCVCVVCVCVPLCVCVCVLVCVCHVISASTTSSPNQAFEPDDPDAADARCS